MFISRYLKVESMENSKEYEWISSDVPDRIEVGAGETINLRFSIKNIQNVKRKFRVSIGYSVEENDSTVDWKAVLNISKKNEVSLLGQGSLEDDIDIDPLKSKNIDMAINAPKGAYPNDKMTLNFSIESEDGVHRFTKSVTIVLKPVIVALKTTVGSEVQVAIDLNNRAEKDREDRSGDGKKLPSEVYAIMAPYEIKGYIFVETMHPDRISYLARDIRGYKGMVSGKIDLEEIAHYLTPKPAVSGLELGSLVELVEGPFKGEKAKIISIDSVKEEVTVQLVESMVPIPVTVKAESIRQLK
ncbi:probable transcription termination-antitermination factor related protein [Thermoplasma acidophilum]|uniref:Transcription elongation factor Spt5 n=2 Tax=Thermoplasma acidophilum TaxID=2303 RepID=Q9HIB6_THEAC|nr:probable transcription termination-antitermination factor related protein [Thermoplasma acidophilum]